MQRLESEVGANLLVRTTRRLSVTDAGRAFYDACRDIVHATESALDAVSSDAGPLRGTLRVSVPIDYGALVV
ncbi:LysR family transcriptional regulator, partial [Pseudomonas sp. SIMBA_064]